MMDQSEQLKKTVRQKYTEIANQEKTFNQSSCCGAGSGSKEVYNIMTDDYSGLQGYRQEADLGLGCGLPTSFAKIKEGDTVVDLGSGAGNDCFIARHETGPTGKVIGIDFTPEMIRKARSNAGKLGFNNVEFRVGDIDDMPLDDDMADVVVSNCVLNLVPDKQKVIQEIMRVLRPGGHFSISDIVLSGELPQALQQDAEMYAGCVAGAIQKETYLEYIRTTGFQNVNLQKEKLIELPEDILCQYLDPEEITAYKQGETGIFSITVFGQKPGSQEELQKTQLSGLQDLSCSPGSGCC